jgi:eukaryotic-like serine/threonine-protein kinase
LAEEQPINKIDDYILIGVIGNGKTCQVYEAMHEQSGAMVAMKLMLPESMSDNDEKALLKHEGKVAQLLEHPNLIRCNGIVMRKTECYLLLDLFKTPNLKMLTHSEPVTVQLLLKKIIEGICSGLQHMHDKGWIHKDLKPENILVNRSAEVRIIDYSLAVKKATALSKVFGGNTGVIRGTRTYLAPETIRKQPSTPATDIYSLGITLYECLTGKPPFTGESPQDLLRRHLAAAAPEPSLLNSNVTPEMDAVIMKMLAKKPKDRFQECSEIVSAISKISIFKEEPKTAATMEEEQQQASAGDVSKLEELMENRLDSRTDALVRKMLEENPALKASHAEIKKKQAERAAAREAEVERRRKKLQSEKSLKEREAEEKKQQKKKKSPRPRPAAPAQPQQMPPQAMPPQQPMPGYYPQQAPPGYPAGMPPQPYAMPPQPGYPQPPPPGYPQMPQPGYPQMPGQPGYPQTPPPGYPQQGGPQPVPPGYGQVPDQPAAPQATPDQAPPAPEPKPPQPAPKPKTPPDDDGMEFMLELPDVE